MSDTTILMGGIFFSIFMVFILSDFALSNAEFKCPEYTERYMKLVADKELLPTEYKSIESDITKTMESSEETSDQAAIQSDYNDTLITETPSPVAEWLNSHGLGFISGGGKALTNIFQNIIGGKGREFAIAFRSALTSGVNTILSKIPFIDKLQLLWFGVTLMTTPCVGLGNIAYVIFTPLIAGMIYIIAKVIRGGG